MNTYATGPDDMTPQYAVSRSNALAGPILAVGLALIAQVPSPALAQRVENSVAVFAALDKVTAKISRLEIPLGQTASFGSLKVTPRACYTRLPTEPPKTTTFVEVEEIQLDGKEKRIFTGWMFADSPGLNAVEHPVFDVWLTECNRPRAGAQRPPAVAVPGAPAAAPEPPPADEPRRRRVPR
jgi:hypothetical protein